MLDKGLLKNSLVALPALAAMALQPAEAVPVALTTNLVFDGVASSDDISSPRLGSEGSGNYVVFQNNAVGPFGTGPGALYLQWLDSEGAATGVPREISRGVGNDFDPDGSGDYIVYTSDNDADGVGDAIRLYDIATGSDFLVRSSTQPVSNARVTDGSDFVIWREQTSVFAQNISTLGTATIPTNVRGPVPAVSDPEVGSRFIVWSEQASGLGLDKEVRAQDIFGSSFFVTPDDLSDGFDEILPTTSANSIAFGLVDSSTGLSDIVLRDPFADTTTSFSLGLEGLSSLSLGADFIAFNALDGAGVMQAYILGLLDGGLLQLTSGAEGSSHVDLFGDLVAYTSGERLFVASLADEVAVVPLPPAVLLFGAGIVCLVGFARRCASKPVAA